MASETGNFSFFEKDGSLRDTERPPDSRDTPLDLTVEAIHAMRDGVVKIEDLSELPREEEVIQRICANANLGRSHLNIKRKTEDNGVLSLLNCRYDGTGVSYVYRAEANRNPVFVKFGDGPRRLIIHPGATVLQRVDEHYNTIEIYRWKD